jgi:hypothetical protein
MILAMMLEMVMIISRVGRHSWVSAAQDSARNPCCCMSRLRRLSGNNIKSSAGRRAVKTAENKGDAGMGYPSILKIKSSAIKLRDAFIDVNT